MPPAERPMSEVLRLWRVWEDDLLAYIEAAYEKTAQRIAAGQIPEETATED